MNKTSSVRVLILLIIISLLVGCSGNISHEQTFKKDIIFSTATTTQDSGLLDLLIPAFEENSGYRVKTIAMGTGAALKMGVKGNADVLLTHAPNSEKVLVDAGNVVDYTRIMHNDFVLVGDLSDEAGVRSATSIKEAFSMIHDAGALFISRGDDSGTHKKELAVWNSIGISPYGTEYQETGSGMGNSLNIAAEKGGYILTDRATYLNLKDSLGNLEILYEGDKELLNIYHVMAVNPDFFNEINYEGAKAFIDFLVSESAQGMIKEYGVDEFGQPLFIPDAIR